MSKLEKYFKTFRKNIIGINQSYHTPDGKKRILYADWTASGRLYKPIEKIIIDRIGPFVANTHTEANITGETMTSAYHTAQEIIKKHVNADSEKDILITSGSGMTAVVNKLQRILGLRVPEKYKHRIFIKEEYRPVVFVTHMEHHSNHTSWLETLCDVVVVEPDENNQISVVNLEQTVKKYRHRKLKIGAFTACSNVTGIETPYHKMAKVMHENGGFCFIDFACSAPYVKMNMRPKNELERLDAIYFSPHKFLGGPGTSGVLIFSKELYKLKIPDQPGGGTVHWTNPWGGVSYYEDIERREDGGTPGFLQVIKTALAIQLKEKMGEANMLNREKELLSILLPELATIKRVKVLQGDVRNRLGVISFIAEGIHYNLFTKLLSDRYGIQVRGGCACAGTYGHYLLNINKKQSEQISKAIEKGDLSEKPGFVRLSVHPTMIDKEIRFIVKAIREICENIEEWQKDYRYNLQTNEFEHLKSNPSQLEKIWFQILN